MYIKNLESLDRTMGHHCAAASITTKMNLKVGKYVQMYRAPFLYLPGAPNSLNLPLIYQSNTKDIIMLHNILI